MRRKRSLRAEDSASGQAEPGPARRAGRLELAALLVILLVALGLRLSYLAELRRAPDLAYPPVDAGFNLYWARGLATGDWALPPDALGHDPEIRTTAYLRPPGYPFVLAACYRLVGGDPLGLRALQMLAGLASVALAWALGRRLLGPAVGLTWATLMGVHWSLLSAEGRLEEAWLVTTLSLVLGLTLSIFAARPTALWASAGGALVGLIALVRPNIQLLAPALLAWAWWVLGRHHLRRRLVALAAGAAVAFAAIVAPCALRNLRVEGRWVPISANGGLTLFVSNNDHATGISASDVAELGLFTSNWQVHDLVARVEQGLGRTLTFTDASRSLGRKALAWVAAHPRRAITLVLRRAALFWGPAELAHSYAVSADRAHSPLLRRLPMAFSLTLTLGLMGLLTLLARRLRWGWTEPVPAAASETLVAILLVILTWFVSFLPFLVTSLYRAPVLPFLLLGGAVFLVHLARLLRARRAAVASWTAAAVVVWLVAGTPLVEVPSDEAKWHYQRAAAWIYRNQRAPAEEELRAALAADPRYWPAQDGLGKVLLESGRRNEAEEHFRAALAAQPADPVARFNLGVALAGRAAWSEAAAAFATAAEAEPRNAEAEARLGMILEQLGRRREAAAAYERALINAPAHPIAANNLAWLRATAADDGLRNGAQAVAIAERLAAVDPSPTVLDTVAAAYAEAGRFTDAVTTAERALRAAEAREPKLAQSIAARLSGYRQGQPHREP